MKDEMVGWHHRLNGDEFEQAPGDGKGQGRLVRCSPWGHQELDLTQRPNDDINSDVEKVQLFGWLETESQFQFALFL